MRVRDLPAGEARTGFRPEEKFLIHVSRNPERIDADVAAARAFV